MTLDTLHAPPQNGGDEEALMEFEMPSSDSEDEFINGRNPEKQAEADMMSEYTDDDTLHSSGDEMITINHRILQRDPKREALTKSVHNTIEQIERQKLHAILQETAAVPSGAESAGRSSSWLREVPIDAIALDASSMIVIPPRSEFRVAAYHLFKHWVFEVYLILLVLSNAVFQACWVRTSADSPRPAFATWVDVFFLTAFIIEAVIRIVVFGLVAHKGAYLRDVWHLLDIAVIILGGLNLANQDTLGNYTGLRLLRIIKSCSLIKRPVGVKIFAKTFLRCCRAILHVTSIIGVALLFFALLGLQLFSGSLRYRCAHVTSTNSTPSVVVSVNFSTPAVLCSPEATSLQHNSILWGHACPSGTQCVESSANANYGYWHFDDIGHSLLAVFQVSTIQGWAALLLQVNATVNTISFLYFFTIIIVCSWFLPSLILGVFMEKADKTRDEFVAAQVKRLDDMRSERRIEALKESVKQQGLGNTVVVDVTNPGLVSTTSAPAPRGSTPSPHRSATPNVHLSGGVDSVTRSERPTSAVRRLAVAVKAPQHNSVHHDSDGGAAQWSEEMRLQLHLSLTRNRALAEDVEADKASHSRTAVSRPGSASASRPASSDGRPQSAASRLDSAASRVAFLNRTTSGKKSSREDAPRGGEVRIPSGPRPGSSVSRGPDERRLPPQQSSAERQPSGGFGDFDALGSRPPSALPNRPDAPLSVPEAAKYSGNTADVVAAEPSASAAAPRIEPDTPVMDVEPTRRAYELVEIADPEGGSIWDGTISERWERVRCMVHMFTEGYPRIITRYLFDAQKSKKKGFADGEFSSHHEVQAREAMKKHKKQHQSPDEELELEEKLKTSPLRMAQNIAEYAPATWFHFSLLGVLLLNTAVLSAYHYPQTDTEDTYQWVIHFAANLFYLSDVLLRIVALGPRIYAASLLNVQDAAVVVVGFIELGFNQTNAITCLRLYRVMSFLKSVRMLRTLRKVSRVLWFCAMDLLYLVVFLMLYMLLVVVYGMNLFGGEWTTGSALDPSALVLDGGVTTSSDFSPRGNFDTFSDAAYASVQAFSRTRDDWLLLTWAAMNGKGDYVVIYFVLSAMAACYIFQSMFVAILAEGFERDDETNDDDEGMVHARGGRRFFDFTLFTRFSKTTGGFARRRIAPDEVFEVRDDMQQRLVIAEHDLDRHLCAAQQTVSEALPLDGTAPRHDGKVRGDRPDAIPIHRLPQVLRLSSPSANDDLQPSNPLQRRVSSAASNTAESVSEPGLLKAQYGASPAYYSHHYPLQVLTNPGPTFALPYSHTQSTSARRSMGEDSTHDGMFPAVDARASLSGAQHPSLVQRHFSQQLSVAAVLTRPSSGPVLLRGPLMRLARHRVNGETVPERCEQCGDFKAAPLRAPAKTIQRSVDDLHAEQCAACSVRVARQQILSTIQRYAALQQELNIVPTRNCIETLLGQAWSCGMMLSETLDELCGNDPATDRKSWRLLLLAVERQQWLLDLRVGQEQVGRATQAYVLAHRARDLTDSDESSDRSFFVFKRSNPIRSFVLDLLSSRPFKAINLLAIVFSSVVLACYNIMEPSTTPDNSTLWALDNAVSVWFLAEVVLKCVAHGALHPYPTAYIYSPWNLFDGFVACVSLASWGIPSLGLRYLKAFRLLHVFSFLLEWNVVDGPLRGLRVLSYALHDSVKGFASIGVFAALNYVVWTIFALHLFAGKTYVCSDGNRTTRVTCNGTYNETIDTVVNGSSVTLRVLQTREWASTTNRTFDQFGDALLTMFEVSTGSWWLDVMYRAVDSYAVDHASVLYQHRYTGLFFIAYYYVAGFVVLGLMSALMIYAFVKAKMLMDGGTGLSPSQQLWLRIQGFLLTFRPQVLLRPLDSAVSRVLHEIAVSRWLELCVSLVVVANVVTMSVFAHGHNDRNEQLKRCEYAWVAVFIFETVVRLGAHGLRTLRHRAHAFDAAMVVLSILQLGLASTAHHRIPFDVNTLRMLRIFRVAHAVRFIPEVRRLRIYGQALSHAAPSIITVTAILGVCACVFAIVGMHAFGGLPLEGSLYLDDKHNNYNTFLSALLMTFRVVTFQSWNRIMRDTLPRAGCDGSLYATCGTHWAPLYFAALLLFVGIVVVSLYAAVMVETYVTTQQMEASIKRLGDIHLFMDLWQEYDPDATMLMPTTDLQHILRRLPPPLGVSHQWDRTEITRLCREYGIADHLGQVHFHEVLIPLAKRTLAWRDLSDGAPLAWQAEESSLSALPVLRHRSTNATAELHFAACYIGAAYRRLRAIRLAHDMRRERWQAGRDFCDANGLPYSGFAYAGRYRLDAAFPECPSAPSVLQRMQEQTALSLAEKQRFTLSEGLSVLRAASPAAATRPTSAVSTLGGGALHSGAASSRVSPRQLSLEPSAPRARSALPDEIRKGLRSSASRVDANHSVAPELVLDSQHTPALDSAHAKLFGPEVPNAIVRGARRTEKMIRKYRNSIAAAEAASNVALAAAAGAADGGAPTYQPPLGTDPSEWQERRPSSAARY